MLTFAQAHELASTWVRIMEGDEVVIVNEHTMKRPYGWVFFYQSRAYLASRDAMGLLGNAPIIVDRISGEIRVTGTGRSIETYLSQYEAGLPPAWMQISLPKEP
jgi:hypothetical protein